ncbi:hypothetical protein D9758_010846 [Tetrapyrgos nigripes]|uniref:MFS general substrate transporter n=1 Tax=Tetrapyrgos nigripes TaxID=182062 RepID=A0A8H5GIL3_9AGAR|nr:hypothetical protein D9758_010846 [Tetrapyrgos nigripes]
MPIIDTDEKIQSSGSLHELEAGTNRKERDQSLEDSTNVSTLTESEERRLWTKIDLRILPIVSLMYLMSFMDRGNIGNARLQGLESQLHLEGNQYNIALTLFFVAYCVFPYAYEVQTVNDRWLPGLTVLWGIVMTLMGLVKNYPQLVATRVLLGVSEAGLFPGVTYCLTLWYPRHSLQVRIALFHGAASLAGAFSGLLAFGISFMDGTQGLLGWSWIFIIEGIATVAVGLLAFWLVVDLPETAKFLTPEERAFVITKRSTSLRSLAYCVNLRTNSLSVEMDISFVGEEEHFEMKHIIQALTDWKLWIQFPTYFGVLVPLYGITLFLPTIINAFGERSTAITQLLTVPPYIFGTILIMLFAHLSDKLKIRSPFILLSLVLCLIEFSINISDTSSGVKYFGTFFIVGGAYAGVPGLSAWFGNNVSGRYRRAVGLALQVGVGNFSGVIASNIYRTQDSPRFVLGHGLELMFVGMGLILLPIMTFIYARINRKRDALEERGGGRVFTHEELRALGDRAPNFRYTL